MPLPMRAGLEVPSRVQSETRPQDRERPPEPARWARANQVILVAVWSALMTGAIHAGIVLVQWRVMHRLVWFSRDFVWLLPLSYLLYFLVPGLLLAAVAVLVPRLASFRLTSAVFVTLGAFSLLLPFTEISRYASLALALGIGVQGARIVGGRPARWLPRLRWSAAAIAVLVVLVGGGMRVWRADAERRALAALPAAPAGAPNVLLIILDTVRAASMSLYGYDRATTPRLEAWAREATVFDQAYSTAPWTLPSHASLFTGVYAGEQSGDWDAPLDGARRTLAEAFRDLGYATAGFVANDDYTSYDSGLDRGFVHYADYRLTPREVLFTSSLGQIPPSVALIETGSLRSAVHDFVRSRLDISPKHVNDRKHGSEVSREFLAWERRQARPYFAFLNYFDAHQPYTSPPPYRSRFTGRGDIDNYDGAIAYLDAQVDTVLGELRRRGVLDNTIVVVASDHGEMLGEHGLWGHAHDLYMPVLHVPLLIRAPARGVAAGVRVRRPVSLRDVAATVLDLAASPDASRFPGTSLAALWSGDSLAAPSAVLAEVSYAPHVDAHLPTSRGAMKALLEERFHYILNGDGVEELYAYRSDPGEGVNLATRSADLPLLEYARAALERLLRDRTSVASGSADGDADATRAGAP